jgi:hypothetical protein
MIIISLIYVTDGHCWKHWALLFLYAYLHYVCSFDFFCRITSVGQTFLWLELYTSSLLTSVRKVISRSGN